MKPVYRDKVDLLKIPQEQLYRDRIPQLGASVTELSYAFKHLKEEKLQKKMKTVGYFLPEMALINSAEQIPGLKEKLMP